MAHQSKARFGSTGTGKTENQKVDDHAIALANDCAIVRCDAKGTYAASAVGHDVAGGMERRVIFEDLASRDGKVLPWDFLPEAVSTDPVQRRLEEEVIREEFKQIPIARKGLASDDATGFTREVLDLSVAAMQYQRPRKPLTWIRSVFEPMSSRFDQIVNDCMDPVWKTRLIDSRRLFTRSPTQWEIWVGSARRMLDVFDSSVIQVRCNGTGGLNWMEALQAKSIITISGAGVPRAAARVVFLSAALQVVNCCRRYHARHRKPLPVVLVLEECGAYQLAAPFILTALQELREAGLAVHVLTQSTMDFEPSVIDKILQNTPGGHYWFKLLSPEDQEKAAADLANVTFDSMAVHHSQSRQVHDGVEEHYHKVKSESKDHHGNLRHDTRDAVNFLPRYREEIVHVYKTPQLQEQEYKTAVANLNVGDFFLRSMEGVHKIKGKMLGTPWPFNLTESRTEQALRRIRSKPMYQPARLPDPPPPPPARPSSSPQPAPKQEETSTAKLRRRATRKRGNT